MASHLQQQEYAVVPIASLRPHPANPRRGNVGAIAQSIAANGFYGAVVAQRSSGHILAGKHRWEAAQAEGLQAIPVFWIDCDDATARRILSADNRVSDLAGYDDEGLARLLTEIRAEAGTLDGTGYDEKAFESLIRQAGNAAIAALEDGSQSEEPGEAPAEQDEAVCPACGRPLAE
jgi:ParB-like chromosome segregation protein Spo0J